MPKKIKVVDANTETPVQQVPMLQLKRLLPKRLLLLLRFPPPTVTESVEVEPAEPVVMKKRDTNPSGPRPRR